jgi:hypothetical protein
MDDHDARPPTAADREGEIATKLARRAGIGQVGHAEAILCAPIAP